MKPFGEKIKRILLVSIGVGFLVSVVVLAVGGVFVSKITARIELPSKAAPNEMDFESGRKKLQLLQQPPETAKRGFVSFSDSELNSILERHYIGRATAATETTNITTCQLQAARLMISSTDAIWTCWVRKKFLGRTWNIAWQRQIVLARVGERWSCKVVSMRLGNFQVSPRYWPYANQFLRDADLQLEELFNWLAQLPALDIAISDTSLRPEFRIYNYPEEKVLDKVTP
jgi:hypothetical protein